MTERTIQPADAVGTLDDGPLLTREAILASSDRLSEEIDVPAWGGPVRLAEIDLDAQSAHQLVIKEHMTYIWADLIVRTVVDADGDRVFGLDDIPDLAKKPVTVLQEIYERCQVINGMASLESREADENFNEAQPESSSTL